MMPTRLDFLDCAKGVSIALVVVFHATIALQQHDLADAHYWLLNNFMSPIRMPVFFFISGFLIRRTVSEPGTDAFVGKVANVAYLFVLWSLLHLAWRSLLPPLPNPPAERGVLFLVTPSSVLWFIWALAIYFCIARAGRIVSKRTIFAAALALSAGIYLGAIDLDSFAHENLLKYLPFFLFGAWYSKPLMHSAMLRHRATFPVLLAVFAGAFAIAYKGTHPAVVEGLLGFLLAMLGVVVGLSAAVFLCRFDLLRKIPTYLGRNTLGIYVAHSPIVAMLAAGLAAASIPATAALLGVPVISAVAILLSLGLKHSLEKAGFWWLYKFPVPLISRRSRPVP